MPSCTGTSIRSESKISSICFGLLAGFRELRVELPQVVENIPTQAGLQHTEYLVPVLKINSWGEGKLDIIDVKCNGII
jgi:hypothetical protein